MPITNSEELLLFISRQLEWEKPGWILNTIVKERAIAADTSIEGGDGDWDLRDWENSLQRQGRLYNGKLPPSDDNYYVNPEKRGDFFHKHHGDFREI